MKGMGELRRKLGLTQAALAEKVGVGVNTIARYERGEMEPSFKIAHTIAEILGCTESELLNGPTKQEFEVKIIMGVKNLPNVAGIEIKDNSCIYGVDDEKPLIHMAINNADIGTPEKREAVFKKLVGGFLKACWMNDHRGEAEPELPDVSALLSMIQPA